MVRYIAGLAALLVGAFWAGELDAEFATRSPAPTLPKNTVAPAKTTLPQQATGAVAKASELDNEEPADAWRGGWRGGWGRGFRGGWGVGFRGGWGVGWGRGWRGGWGGGWRVGWRGGWGPGWRVGWRGGWGGGWRGGWSGGWGRGWGGGWGGGSFPIVGSDTSFFDTGDDFAW